MVRHRSGRSGSALHVADPQLRDQLDRTVSGGEPHRPGEVQIVSFHLGGTPYTALNGGPEFQFNPAVSLVVNCGDQAEIDRLWAALTDGGQESMCGWLVDRFGLSWQIIPENIGSLIKHPAAMQAMLTMRKLDIATLEAAAS